MNKADLSDVRGFEWDDANTHKIWDKHGVAPTECEQVCFRRPLVVAADVGRSDDEERYYALGRTDLGRRLFVVFTLRGERIRVISARDMSRREREVLRRAEDRS